jgi:hypothetical protein
MLEPAPGLVGTIRRYNEAHPDNTYNNSSFWLANKIDASDHDTLFGKLSSSFSALDAIDFSSAELWSTASANGCPNLDQYRSSADVKAAPTPPIARH